MSNLRKKLHRAALSGLSLTLCASLIASTALFAQADTRAKRAGVSTTQSLGFTDVTGKFDNSALREANFNSSVKENTPTARYETRTVIVSLEGDSILEYLGGNVTPAEYLATAQGKIAVRNIESEQRAFLNKLNSKGISFRLKSSYVAVDNAVAIEIDTSRVSEIKKMDGVDSVVISRTHLAPESVETRSSTSDITNDANVNATGIYDASAVAGYDWGTGDGTIVAILDTGLDYTHPAFTRVGDNLKFTHSYVDSRIESTEAYRRMSDAGVTLTTDDVYVSDKVPFAFDYSDDDADVYPSYSNHGTHVAGIVAGYNESGYDDKDGNHIDIPFTGVAPDAQLMICKVFTDDLDDKAVGGAEAENIMSALEDCVKMNVDVINMSLGSTAGFTTTDDGDDEGEHLNKVFESIRKAGISLICAASNDYSAGYGSAFGTNLATNPDSGTVGSPSTYYAALSVASISGQKSKYLLSSDGDAIFYDESSDGNAVQYDFQKLMFEKLGVTGTKAEIEYVVVPNIGQPADYASISSLFAGGKRLALIRRGTTNFQKKVEIAWEMGAAGVIVYNNVTGSIRMSLGDLDEEKFLPAISITKDAGEKLIQLADRSRVGTITVDTSLDAGPFMSDFSSWGTTPDLKLKPEITAHGGEITSTVPGGYAEQSGTSMASPNMAGLMALVRNYVKETFPDSDAQQITRLSNQLVMSTATTVKDRTGDAYSPRKQGAGLANINNIIGTSAYLFTDDTTGNWYEGKDYRPKVELGDDKNKVGEYEIGFKLANFGTAPLSFKAQTLFMTETLASDNLAVAEKAKMLSDKGVYSVSGGTLDGDIITVASGATATVTVRLKLTADEKAYLDKNFKNGMFVEGFIKLLTVDGNPATQCDLTLPFVGFYGDWNAAPMLDYDVFEIAAIEQDTSILDEEKDKAAVFATQAYANYSNDRFIIPLGSYTYVQDEDADKIYADRDYCAVSRFNNYYSDDGVGNYLTTTSIRCLYAGLLRNAKKVDYKLYDAYTGELILSKTAPRISKAYASGGSARPAYVELELDPQEIGLLANGKYRMDFEFYFNEDSPLTQDNIFSFDFYVDYDAPVLQNARLRYYNYKDGDADKQRIYIDFDIYDNHYVQAIMLCYVDLNDEVQTMNLATEYITPVRNPNKNGTTTVSIEVTDIWEQYKDVLAIEIDDYALNHSMYILNSVNGTTNDADKSLNAGVLPDTFKLAEGEEEITLGLNETHKVSLVYEGDADLSNFDWSIGNNYVDMKNGELFGRAVTRTPVRMSVNNRKGVSRTFKVNVVDTGTKLSVPNISFAAIKDCNGALTKPVGSVRVNAGTDINLQILTDPWYYRVSDLDIEFSTSNPARATVDKNGLVHTIAKGSVQIVATIKGTSYSTALNLYVRDPFTVSNMTLTEYNGDGETVDGVEGVVVIPDDKNIMTIGDEAFKDNTKITKVIIPKTVTTIEERAFIGCTSLKEVYFISEEKLPVEDSNLTLINKRAFYGLPALEKVDFSNVKVITVAREAFADCTALREVVKSTAIGTAYDRVFMGCTSLKEFDLSGLHVAGANIFSGCTSLESITTDRYTAIGADMFAPLTYGYQVYEQISSGRWGYVQKTREIPACTSLGADGIVIKTPNVSVGAFEGCTAITSVKFEGVSGITVGEYAFNGCTALKVLDYNGCSVKSLGAHAFDGTAVSDFGGNGDAYIVDGNLIKYNGTAESYTVPADVTAISAYAFAGSNVKSVDFSLANVERIGAYAFMDCKNLLSVTVPASVTVLGDGVFAGCGALESVTFASGSAITSIPAYTFMETGISSITLPATVSSIGNYAFAGSKLATFNYAPNGNAALGSYVFAGCTALENIALADNIASMGNGCFANCTSLTGVKLPSLEALGSLTFAGDVALETLTYGSNAKVTGSYNFGNNEQELAQIKVKSVTLGSGVTEIGEGAFYGLSALTNIDLKGATAIGAYAFARCENLATVTGIASVTNFGAYAFYGAVSLGNFSITGAESVGEYAFFGAKTAANLTVPATLTEIGGGAFSGGETASFAVASGNDAFFVQDGVLYRKLTENTYELTAYPAKKAAAAASGEYAALNGKKVYRILDGTVTVLSSAFDSIGEGMIEAVILPYSLQAIGDMAFYNTDIREFCFESIAAPALLGKYNPVIDVLVTESGENYKGNYLANFVDELFVHSDIAAAYPDLQPVSLKIYYPENGSGYTNHVYSMYFDRSETIGVLIDDNTRACKTAIESMPSAEEVSRWTTSDKTRDEIVAFANEVKEARRLYNNILDDKQLELLGSDNAEKLTAVESALRQVKKLFGLSSVVTDLTYETDSTFKSEYKEGETFDWTGLTVIVRYDDGSSEVASRSELTLKTGPLTIYDAFVVIEGYGKQVRVVVSVKEDNGGNTDPSDDGKKDKGCKSALGATDCAIVAGSMLAVAGFALILRRKGRKNND